MQVTRDLQEELTQKAEEAVPKTWRDYLAPLNLLIFPSVACLVWFWGIPWLQMQGFMVSYMAVWYLCITALSVFFSIWVFQHLDDWSNRPRNQKVQAKRIELELLRHQQRGEEQ